MKTRVCLQKNGVNVSVSNKEKGSAMLKLTSPKIFGIFLLVMKEKNRIDQHRLFQKA
jgi:hypothetical protein